MAGAAKTQGTAEDRLAKYGSVTHWKMVGGQWIPPEKQLRYLQEYLMAWPRPYDTKQEWADANEVTVRTLNNWENEEKFTALWKRLSDKQFTHPDFLNPIVMGMQRIVSAAWDDPDIRPADRIRASETLWRMIEKMSPPTRHTEEPEMDEDLSRIDESDLLDAVTVVGVDGDEAFGLVDDDEDGEFDDGLEA